MVYIPLHDREDYIASVSLDQAPRYASPDLDPLKPYPWIRMSEQPEAGPSRKRARNEQRVIPIAPSIFGISPRNEFTKVVGEFIMTNCRGLDNVEVCLNSIELMID